MKFKIYLLVAAFSFSLCLASATRLDSDLLGDFGMFPSPMLSKLLEPILHNELGMLDFKIFKLNLIARSTVRVRWSDLSSLA